MGRLDWWGGTCLIAVTGNGMQAIAGSDHYHHVMTLSFCDDHGCLENREHISTLNGTVGCANLCPNDL